MHLRHWAARLRSHDGRDCGQPMPPTPAAFLDTAAVMMHLDLVVTSDTSIAHLAGALGREVFVALRKIPDWRFLLGRDDSPWYPSMRLFRQADPGNWRDVFERIAQVVREQTGPPAKQFALYSPWLQ